jgi:SAM-dependent methyltransferase
MTSLLRETMFGRFARRLRWSLFPSAEATPATGRLSVQSAPRIMETSTPANWVVRIENHSRRILESPRLRHQWITPSGATYSDAIATTVPRSLLPGDWIDTPVSVMAPAAVGDFRLAWSLVEPALACDPVPIPVTFPTTTDIDYHHVYATADLKQNSWWVVGAYVSKEHYEQSSRERRVMLIEQGLTPDSRVLDIGCGTGQMAMALEDYLTDRGAFYGTDIGREGIEFCRANYKRPNFAFEVGGMTTVPFATSTGPFDMAIFFSVFTHTHVDESMLLLAECDRLLGPKGVVVADIIASDLVEREGGHRGQMWVNRNHFLRLAEAVGFRANIVFSVPWAPDAVRLMIRFERK